MTDEYLEMYAELSNLIIDDNIPTGSDVLEILKKYLQKFQHICFWDCFPVT